VHVVNVGQEFQQKMMENDGRFDDALNSVAVQLISTVRAHTFAFMLNNFALSVKSTPEPSVAKVIGKVCALFACSNILDQPHWNGLLDSHHLRLVRSATSQLLNELRPDVVSLVDAFDIPDRVLNSTIGRADGNVYEALFEAAQRSTLNQVEPFMGYKEVLQPYLDLEFLKRGNKVPQSKL